jgi:pyruvate/2-oxoglutarate dehydrogenase complex dihydrolipoamide dehydrogenase (E3) component
VAWSGDHAATRGSIKILVDAESNAILGALLLGTECDEVVHSLLDAMYARAPCTVIQRDVHIHPTVTELIPRQSLPPLDRGDLAV